MILPLRVRMCVAFLMVRNCSPFPLICLLRIASSSPCVPALPPGLYAERVRDYWNQRPCNIRYSTQPGGAWEYLNEVEARKYCVEPHMEIGCGIFAGCQSNFDTVNCAQRR